MKRLEGNRILENCGQCSLKIHLLPEKGLGHLGYKCSKLNIKVEPNTIHPKCPLQTVEVITDEETIGLFEEAFCYDEFGVDSIILVKKLRRVSNGNSNNTNMVSP
jgi:hypothetical protein